MTDSIIFGLASLLCLTLAGTTTINGAEVEWKVIEGERRALLEDGEEILGGSGLIQLTNVPDGDFALQVEFLTRVGGASIKLLLRGPELGKGLILNLNTSPWMGFQHNLRPGDDKLNDSVYFVVPADREEWWTLKAQMWDGRLMAKAWASHEPEPIPTNSDGYDPAYPPKTKWFFDYPTVFDTTGPVGIFSASKLRNLRLVPVEPTAHRHLPRDHRQLRFGGPRKTWSTKVAVEETDDEIVVDSELTRLVFDRTTCSIRLAVCRGEEFPVGSLPDLKIVDETGREFRQRYASDGALRLVEDESNRHWIVLTGSFTPRAKSGSTWPRPFRVEYRIHRQTGLIEVRATHSPTASSRIRQLVFVNSLADSPSQGLNNYQVIASGRFFGKGHRAVAHNARVDETIVGRRASVATWGNGRCAFQVTPSTFRGFSIAPELFRSKTAYRHVALGTRNGHRTLDVVVINHNSGDEVALAEKVAYEYTFSFLPWRRYRPRVELVASSRVWADSRLWSLSYEQKRLQRMAEMGVTLHGLGYPPYGLLADELHHVRVSRQVAASHYFGIKDMVSWVGGTRWPRERAIDAGWISLAESHAASRTDRERLHEHINHEQEIPDQLCLNTPVWRHMTVDRINIPVLKKFNSSAVYWDWTWPIYYCDNERHGDEGVSLSPVGHVKMIDRYLEAAARLPERPAVMGCTYDAHCTPVSHLDMFNPGESGKGWWLPNRAEHNLIYSSLLYGTQCVYHTAGGIANDTPRVYELALARCATVFFGDENWDPPAHDPPGTPGGYNKEEREMWIRYMTPLVIFGVEDSEYRHPFDEDYAQYCRSERGVTTIVYYKKGRAFVVMVKEDPQAHSGWARLNLPKLGIATGEALVFDVIRRTARTLLPAGDELVIANVDLKEGPRFFVVEGAPRGPQVLWHNPSVWHSQLATTETESVLKLTGVPGAQLEALVWYGSRSPSTVAHGDIESDDANSRIVTLTTTADPSAHAELQINWKN